MATVETKIATNGRVVIPVALRREANIKPEERVYMEAREGEIRIMTYRSAVREAQEIVSRFAKPGRRRISDELIAERRAEAKREARDDEKQRKASRRRD